MQKGLSARSIKVDERDQFIPVRKSDILGALNNTGLSRYRRAGEIPAVLPAARRDLPLRVFRGLEKLRDDYYYFNPENPLEPKRDPQTIEQARLELLETLEKVLKGANYVEVPLAEIEQAHEEHVLKVKVETTMEHYHQVRFFGAVVTRSRWTSASGLV